MHSGSESTAIQAETASAPNASTVAAFLAELGVDRYAVAGNSLGGNIAWNLTLAIRNK